MNDTVSTIGIVSAFGAGGFGLFRGLQFNEACKIRQALDCAVQQVDAAARLAGDTANPGSGAACETLRAHPEKVEALRLRYARKLDFLTKFEFAYAVPCFEKYTRVEAKETGYRLKNGIQYSLEKRVQELSRLKIVRNANLIIGSVLLVAGLVAGIYMASNKK